MEKQVVDTSCRRSQKPRPNTQKQVAESSSSKAHTSCGTSQKPRPNTQTKAKMLKPKQRNIALMEIISYGTPQKLAPRVGTCHRVSPLPKKYENLQRAQLGIKGFKQIAPLCEVKPFTEDELGFLKTSSNLQIVNALINHAVSEALTRERERHIFLEDIERLVILRSLVAEWKSTSAGKGTLADMKKAINNKYASVQKQRRVQDGDVLVELKVLIRGGCDTTEIVDAISSCCPDLGGEGFLELIQSYVTTNKQVHPEWSLEKLKRLVHLSKQGDLKVGGGWIQRMAKDIATNRRWNLSS